MSASLPINNILSAYRLGRALGPPQRVSSGLVNTVFSLRTDQGDFILKLIDLSQPRARRPDEYRAIERLKARFAQAGVPVVEALRQQDDPLLPLDEHRALIAFPRVPADVICPPIGPMPEAEARTAGTILGRLHDLAITQLPGTPSFSFDYRTSDAALAHYLEQAGVDLDTRQLVARANRAHFEAYAHLMPHAIFGHGDFFPHNLIFTSDAQAYVIDFELAGLVSATMELVLGCILFSGMVTADGCRASSFQAFLAGYKQHATIQHHELEDGFWAAIGKAWLNWIAYNFTCGDRPVAMQTLASLPGIIERKDWLLEEIAAN